MKDVEEDEYIKSLHYREKARGESFYEGIWKLLSESYVNLALTDINKGTLCNFHKVN